MTAYLDYDRNDDDYVESDYMDPRCNICGQPEHPSPYKVDWNIVTGNHKTCEINKKEEEDGWDAITF